MTINIKGIIEIEKIAYTGCQIIGEEVIKAKMKTIFDNAFSASDLNEPMQLGTCNSGGHYDPWDHIFKKNQ